MTLTVHNVRVVLLFLWTASMILLLTQNRPTQEFNFHLRDQNSFNEKIDFGTSTTFRSKPPETTEKNSVDVECKISQQEMCLYGISKNKSEADLLCNGPHSHIQCSKQIRSVMVTKCNGRLGNIMMAYATLYYFNKRYGFNSCITELQEDRLLKTFKPQSLTIKKGEFVNASLSYADFEDVHEKDEAGRYHYDNMMADIEKYKYNRLLDVGQYPLGFQLFEEIWPDLIHQFQFEDDVKESAASALYQSSEKARELYAGKELVYVALHCRRGDYVTHFMTKEYYVDEMLWVRYFAYCIETYRQMLDTEKTKSVFVMLSDDVPWLRKHFGDAPDSVFPDTLAPLQEDRMPGRDMAIFSYCHHLIKNIGTFGVWAGFFVNGTVMYPVTGDPGMEDEGIVGALQNLRWIPVHIKQFQMPIP